MTHCHDREEGTEDIPKTPIGKRIKMAREGAKISQAHLGQLLSPPKSFAAISDIESGKSQPSWETVVQVASALEVSLNFFTDQYCPECKRDYAEL